MKGIKHTNVNVVEEQNGMDIQYRLNFIIKMVIHIIIQ